ncbi:MAG: hypothetical protein HUU09_00045 [Candidatus Jettenia caeni]|nr:hypothetical protein [Candidatus Jettenia sp. AMX1]NUN21842.1 hypothetical protein [Candidatus Jettenia caeni]WKZ14928.1 MAG: hypothetical protein QY317_13600 [Candidatus Jettenia caeni]GJQ45737.1 MAG: hypothetical protein JETCAE04_14910 [Candidatus Jettenia caeni]
MNCVLRKVLILFIVVVLSGIYMSCSGPSKKDTTNDSPQHGHGGGCGH